MITAVLFDVDDTLTDYHGAERAGILRYLAQLGVPAARQPAGADLWRAVQQRHFARYIDGELSFAGQRRARVVDMAEWLGDTCADPDTWFEGYRACYEAVLAPFDDVAGCLRRLDRLALGVISNNDEAYTRKKLELTGLAGHFRCVLGRDTVGRAKPDREIFHAGCAALGVGPAHTAYVGDHLDMDARGATAAGLTGIWLDRGSAGPSDTGPSDTGPVDNGVLRIRGLGQLPGLIEDLTAATPAASRGSDHARG
ncbi:MAG: HAD family hydrolase [Micromonosporaceae bacterium]